MDLMLSLSRHCSLGGGLAQWSAPGCVAGWVCGRDVGAAGEGAEVERRRRGRGGEVGRWGGRGWGVRWRVVGSSTRRPAPGYKRKLGYSLKCS